MFLGTVNQLGADDSYSAEQATSIQRHAASFNVGTARLLKAFQKMLSLMAAASLVLRLRLLRMRSIQFWLKQRVPAAAWRHGRHRVMVTQACVSALTSWRNPLWLERGVTLDTVHRRKVVTTDASNKGWGALCVGKPTYGLWYEEESTLRINCLEMLTVCQVCQFFLPVIRGHHVLVRSDSRSQTLYAGKQPSCVGPEQSAKGNAYAGQNEPRSRNVVEEQRIFGGMDASQIWEIFGMAQIYLILSLPKLFYKEHRCPGPQMAQPSTLCLSPNCYATAGAQASQGTTAQASFNSPPLEEPTVGVRIIPAVNDSPVTNPPETGLPLSSERHDMASTARVMGPYSLPERVLNTMSEELELHLLDASTL